jgi:hypothetical protein
MSSPMSSAWVTLCGDGCGFVAMDRLLAMQVFVHVIESVTKAADTLSMPRETVYPIHFVLRPSVPAAFWAM